MRRILKFRLEETRGTVGGRIPLPSGSQILACQAQDDAIVLWAIVEDGAPSAPRRAYLAVTGEELPKRVFGWEHHGTVQLREGRQVAHVLIEPEPPPDDDTASDA